MDDRGSVLLPLRPDGMRTSPGEGAAKKHPTTVGRRGYGRRATAGLHDHNTPRKKTEVRKKMEKRKKEYTKDMPARLYSFFRDFSEGGTPSLLKFAVRCGITLKELEEWRANAEFDRACAECAEIRRDMLIDAALTKRHDSSFTKFLLSAEFGMGESTKEGDGRLDVSIEVVE